MLGGSGALPANVGTSMRRPSAESLENPPERAREPMLAMDKRIGDFAEVMCALTPGAACAEAGRCLRCDLERADALEKART
jgi:hypothetical protein